MIYTDLTRKAMKIAYEAHKGQVDKAGLPYIYHPIHLAEQMETEDTCVVALLHDVVEDTDITIDDLMKAGFSDSQLDAIRAMTHEEDVEYLDYVREVKKNPIATAVKIADIMHNSDIKRIEKPTEKDLSRYERKYKAAMDILK